MYRLIAKIMPKNMRDSYEDLLRYAAIKTDPNKFIGFVLFFGLASATFLAFVLAKFLKISPIILFLIIFFLIESLVYVWLLLHVDAKAKFIEGVLPDALQLMSSNLRAGLTTDRALLLSARPEFGPLQDEINTVGKEITMGVEIGDSLMHMTERVKSDKLKKTVMLIVSGLKSGGELASLLEQTAKNLRRQRLVEEKIRANVMMYVIFIFVAVAFGAPMLFGLSSFLVGVLTKNIAAMEIPETIVASSMPVTFSKISITPHFVLIYAVTSMITTAFLGSLILGLIAKGKEKEGLKFIPILVICSVGIFFLVRFFIGALLGGLFGM